MVSTPGAEVLGSFSDRGKRAHSQKKLVKAQQAVKAMSFPQPSKQKSLDGQASDSHRDSGFSGVGFSNDQVSDSNRDSLFE
jgi:hypothetical protein